MPGDPYTTLGVPKTASADEVKKAYRKLAHQYHPDKTGGDDKKFKEVNEAYQTLSDSQKRKQYDTFGHAGSQGGFGGGQGFGGFSAGGGSAFGGDFDLGDIFDMFGGAFGGGFTEQAPEASKGEDIYLEVPVSKKDLGKTKIFEFSAHNKCDNCDATGIAPGSKLKDCGTCKGNGQIRQQVRTPFGIFTQVAVCPECKGKRKLPEKICPKCKGAGRVEGKRTIEVHLPDDIDDGYNIVFPKQGNAGKEGKPSGDLLLTFKHKTGWF